MIQMIRFTDSTAVLHLIPGVVSENFLPVSGCIVHACVGTVGTANSGMLRNADRIAQAPSQTFPTRSELLHGRVILLYGKGLDLTEGGDSSPESQG